MWVYVWVKKGNKLWNKAQNWLFPFFLLCFCMCRCLSLFSCILLYCCCTAWHSLVPLLTIIWVKFLGCSTTNLVLPPGVARAPFVPPRTTIRLIDTLSASSSSSFSSRDPYTLPIWAHAVFFKIFNQSAAVYAKMGGV